MIVGKLRKFSFRSERDRLRDEIKALTKELRETRNGLDEVYDSIDDLESEHKVQSFSLLFSISYSL